MVRPKVMQPRQPDDRVEFAIGVNVHQYAGLAPPIHGTSRLTDG